MNQYLFLGYISLCWLTTLIKLAHSLIKNSSVFCYFEHFHRALSPTLEPLLSFFFWILQEGMKWLEAAALHFNIGTKFTLVAVVHSRVLTPHFLPCCNRRRHLDFFHFPKTWQTIDLNTIESREAAVRWNFWWRRPTGAWNIYSDLHCINSGGYSSWTCDCRRHAARPGFILIRVTNDVISTGCILEACVASPSAAN